MESKCNSLNGKHSWYYPYSYNNFPSSIMICRYCGAYKDLKEKYNLK